MSNNKSSLVQEWTTAKLKKTAISLYSSIYQVECFSSGDIRDYEAVVAELGNRGYEVHVQKTITFKKG